jgi:hypothetical protein
MKGRAHRTGAIAAVLQHLEAELGIDRWGWWGGDLLRL